MPDGSYLISGLLPIQEVNERFQLDLRDPYYETIAGFVLGRLGRIARVGDEVEAGDVRLRVEAMDGLRIARLRLIPRRALPASAG
jgi:CBS domain containing-hemolysin-like protein